MSTDPVTITLEERIADIEKITLRPPRAKDLWDFCLPEEGKNPPIGDMLEIACKIADAPKSIIEEMTVKNTLEVIEAVSLFLLSGDLKPQNN